MSAAARFAKPLREELVAYAREIGYTGFDPDAFLDYYDQVGWLVGKARKPMKDWRAAVRTWRRNDASAPKSATLNTEERDYARQAFVCMTRHRGMDIGRLWTKIRDTLGNDSCDRIKIAVTEEVRKWRAER